MSFRCLSDDFGLNFEDEGASFGSKLSNAVYTKLIYLNNMYYHAMNIIMLEN